MTKRDKRDKSNLDKQRDSVTRETVGLLSRHACPRPVQNPSDELALLKAEVLAYLDGYTSRGMRSEGLALARLKKAVDQ